MKNARLLHFFLLSITILLLSCTKKGEPKPNSPVDDFMKSYAIYIYNGKYTAKYPDQNDPAHEPKWHEDQWFIIEDLVLSTDTLHEDFKSNLWPNDVKLIALKRLSGVGLNGQIRIVNVYTERNYSIGDNVKRQAITGKGVYWNIKINNISYTINPMIADINAADLVDQYSYYFNAKDKNGNNVTPEGYQGVFYKK